MKTSVHEDRLLVVSDIHMGNWLFHARRPFVRFLRYALEQEYNLCINGDGVDIMQMSVSNLTRDLSEAYTLFRQFAARGLRIYYTVGNHDIALEHFLRDWGAVAVVPFLNVTSGDLRIRVEHGHMYDEMFLRYPRTYVAVTVIGRFLLSLDPKYYFRFEILNIWLKGLGRFAKRMRGENIEVPPDGIPGEEPSFRRAAEEISLRGFDVVTFGHTHKHGQVLLRSGATYYNTGSWLLPPMVLEIADGRVWYGSVEDFMARPPAPAASPARPGIVRVVEKDPLAGAVRPLPLQPS